MSEQNDVNVGYPASLMGDLLKEEVERQLKEDLLKYNFDASKLQFDWSDVCQEGHCTKYMGGELESMSCVSLVDEAGDCWAEGWIDFIHGDENMPLNVFWLFLDLKNMRSEWVDVKTDARIPKHVWDRLSVEQKNLCCKSSEYDSIWSKDPLVVEWRNNFRS